MDVSCDVKYDVETKFNKLGADTKPAVWKNRVVEARDALETYPAEPRPATVDVIEVISVPPGPKAVEKEERAAFKDSVET